MDIKVKDKPHKSIHHHVQSYPMLATPTDSKHGKYQNYYSLNRKKKLITHQNVHSFYPFHCE